MKSEQHACYSDPNAVTFHRIFIIIIIIIIILLLLLLLLLLFSGKCIRMRQKVLHFLGL